MEELKTTDIKKINIIILTPFVGCAVVLYHILKSKAPDTTFVFTDRNTLLHDMKYDGVEIISAEQAKNQYADAMTIICAAHHSKAILKKYSDLGFKNIETNYQQFFSKDIFIKAVEKVCFKQLEDFKPNVKNAIENFMTSWDAYFPPTQFLYKDALVFDRVNLTITTRCSLRCKDCCSNIQYYQRPSDFSLETNIDTFDAFMQRIDYVKEFALLGGEPFLYRQLAELIIHITYSEYVDKIGRVALVTNGTILPDEKTLCLLKKHGIHVYISDYGEHSKKIAEIVAAFDDYSIFYEHKPNMIWYSSCKIIDGETVQDEEAQKRFEECEAICRELRQGKFYYCSFLAAVYDLKAVPDTIDNGIDLMDGRTAKEDIRRYIEKKSTPSEGISFYPGCRWCSGCDFKTPLPMAAVQICEPLPYKRYE